MRRVIDVEKVKHLDRESFAKILAPAKKVVLYHGTSFSRLPSILEKGLLPRESSGISNYRGCKNREGRDIESLLGRVYLGTRDAADACRYSAGLGEEDGVILRVMVNTNTLLPDEKSQFESWYESLHENQQCATKGDVKPEDILGYGIIGGGTHREEEYVPLRKSLLEKAMRLIAA